MDTPHQKMYEMFGMTPNDTQKALMARWPDGTYHTCSGRFDRGAGKTTHLAVLALYRLLTKAQSATVYVGCTQGMVTESFHQTRLLLKTLSPDMQEAIDVTANRISWKAQDSYYGIHFTPLHQSERWRGFAVPDLAVLIDRIPMRLTHEQNEHRNTYQCLASGTDDTYLELF